MAENAPASKVFYGKVYRGKRRPGRSRSLRWKNQILADLSILHWEDSAKQNNMKINVGVGHNGATDYKTI